MGTLQNDYMAHLSETMSVCDPLRSPEFEYMGNHDASVVHTQKNLLQKIRYGSSTSSFG